jgi:hypothetical protein
MLRIARAFQAFFLMLMSLVFALIALVSFSIAAITFYADDTRALDGEEMTHINKAQAYISDVSHQNGRLPTSREFSQWADKMTEQGFAYDGKGFGMRNGPFSSRLERHFGKAPPGAYVLYLWNGEVSLDVPSWREDPYKGLIDESACWFGSNLADIIACLAVGCISLGLAFGVSRR